jgi:hypothetical protein
MSREDDAAEEAEIASEASTAATTEAGTSDE